MHAIRTYMYRELKILFKLKHYQTLRCLLSWGIAGHSLNLHSLHIWNNKTVELTSTVTHTPMFYTAMEFTYIGTPTPITTMSEDKK